MLHRTRQPLGLTGLLSVELVLRLSAFACHHHTCCLCWLLFIHHAVSPAAGVPANTAQLYCPSHANATSCYYFNTASGSFATQKTSCAALGGYLVAYNSAFEELDVETYFATTVGLMSSTDYVWIGLEKSGNLWYWPDGRATCCHACTSFVMLFLSCYLER